MLGKKIISFFGLCWIACSMVPVVAQDTLSGNPKSVNESKDASKKRCLRDNHSDIWIDKLQANTHTGLCRTVRWIDGLFGDTEEFNTNDFSGRVIFGLRHDDEDGFDPRLRVRVKSKLPNLSKRFNAFIGRFDEEEFVTENNNSKTGAVSRNTISGEKNEDASWLIGLGYSQKKNRGFDASVGAKISSGINPYALVRYRYLVTTESPHYLNLTQSIFWRRDERYGFSSELDYSYTLGKNDIIGFGAGAKYTTEEKYWETKSALTWYHKFAKKSGIATRLFARDSDEYSASLPEYGINLTYRRPFLREWSFIEFGIENRWEQKQKEDPRESYFRVGVQVEIQFGRYYERKLRARL